MADDENKLHGIPLVSTPSRKLLNERQKVDYREDRRQCLEWLLNVGKDPAYAEGYALGTVKPRAKRMDQFYRWVWEEEGGYTVEVTHQHADAPRTAGRDGGSTGDAQPDSGRLPGP